MVSFIERCSSLHTKCAMINMIINQFRCLEVIEETPELIPKTLYQNLEFEICDARKELVIMLSLGDLDFKMKVELLHIYNSVVDIFNNTTGCNIFDKYKIDGVTGISRFEKDLYWNISAFGKIASNLPEYADKALVDYPMIFRAWASLQLEEGTTLESIISELQVNGIDIPNSAQKYLDSIRSTS